MSWTLPAGEAATLILYLLVLAFWIWTLRPAASPPSPYRRRREPPAEPPPPPSSVRGRKKPQWVRDVVIKLKALNPDPECGSCRKIAATFCAMYLGVERVGKTWVAELFREEKYRIEVARKRIRGRKPPIMPRNLIWGVDLTGVPLADTATLAFGIIDHGVRACIALREVESKHSLILLREICAAIRKYGKPDRIRTDNEAVFTSRTFRWGLKLLGIRHQLIDKMAPWQNGRIERFFGTFKGCCRRFLERTGRTFEEVQPELDILRFWYNFVRPHMHLDGRVPADVWAGIEPQTGREHAYFCEWEEVLTGYHFR